jgi:hypothetical protein
MRFLATMNTSIFFALLDDNPQGVRKEFGTTEHQAKI